MISPSSSSCLFPLNPNSQVHLWFDILSVVVLIVDLTLIPYAMAWNVPYVGLLEGFAWFTAIFWTWDIVLTFLTGFSRDGEVEMRIEKIALNYLRHWFGLDAMIVVCDWVSIIVLHMLAGESTTAAGVRMLRFAKLSRLVRIFGLLRIFRLARISEDIIDRFLTEGWQKMFRVLCIFSAVVWLNHIIGCTWYALGSGLIAADTGFQWHDSVVVVDGDSKVS